MLPDTSQIIHKGTFIKSPHTLSTQAIDVLYHLVMIYSILILNDVMCTCNDLSKNDHVTIADHGGYCLKF